jgi:hypothetical protein
MGVVCFQPLSSTSRSQLSNITNIMNSNEPNQNQDYKNALLWVLYFLFAIVVNLAIGAVLLGFAQEFLE